MNVVHSYSFELQHPGRSLSHLTLSPHDFRHVSADLAPPFGMRLPHNTSFRNLRCSSGGRRHLSALRTSNYCPKLRCNSPCRKPTNVDAQLVRERQETPPARHASPSSYTECEEASPTDPFTQGTLMVMMLRIQLLTAGNLQARLSHASGEIDDPRVSIAFRYTRATTTG